MRGRTTLIISHRLSSLRAADRIIVIEQGRVRESGTHDTLSAADTMYRRMLKLQSAALAEFAT
jgi:ABC-type multidrug transport system fused ATPase/permease subunit